MPKGVRGGKRVYIRKDGTYKGQERAEAEVPTQAKELGVTTLNSGRKIRYSITHGDVGFVDVDGYQYKIGGYNVGIHKGGQYWTATELDTGYSLSVLHGTRASALQGATDALYRLESDPAEKKRVNLERARVKKLRAEGKQYTTTGGQRPTAYR